MTDEMRDIIEKRKAARAVEGNQGIAEVPTAKLEATTVTTGDRIMPTTAVEAIKFFIDLQGYTTGYFHLPYKPNSNGRATQDEWKAVGMKELPCQIELLDKNLKSWAEDHPAKTDDLYFLPAVSSTGDRQKQPVNHILPSRILKADDVTPAMLKKLKAHGLEPSYTWESSQDNFYAVWVLDVHLPQEKYEALNRRITNVLGADKCWAINHVFRVPFTLNHKVDRRVDDKPYPVGGLVQGRVAPYTVAEVTAAVEKLERAKGIVSQAAPESVTTETVDDRPIVKYAPDKLEHKLDRIHGIKATTRNMFDTDDIEGMDKSDVLWGVYLDLRQAGVSRGDIIKMVASCTVGQKKFKTNQALRADIERCYMKHPDKKTEKPTVAGETGEYLETETLEELLGSFETDPGWLVDGWWTRHGVGIVAGIPKSGKSILTTDFAVSVASGMKFLGRYEVHNPGPVLIIQNENAKWIMKARLQQIIEAKGLAGTIKEKDDGTYEIVFAKDIPIETVNNTGFKLDDEDGRAKFEATVRKMLPALVILDPFYLMFSGDTTKANEVIPILRYLLEFKNQMVSEGHGFSLILVHHYNKGGDGKSGASQTGGQRIHGTTFFHGWVESAWYITKAGKKDGKAVQTEEDEEDEDYRGPLKMTREFRAGDNGRFGPVLIKTSLDEMDEDGVYRVQVWDEVAGDIVKLTPAEIREELMKRIPASPSKVKQSDVIKDFMEEHGETTSDKKLKRHIDELVKEGKINKLVVSKNRTDLWRGA